MNTNDNRGSIFLAFLAGVASGATLLALAAPSTRGDLKEGMEHLTSTLKRKAGRVAAKAEEGWEEARERLKES